MHWAVGDSFLSSPSDREVKRPHLVGADLWVTSEVAMQTWGSLPRREKSFPQHLPGLAPCGLQARGFGNSFLSLSLPASIFLSVTAGSSSGHN